MQLSVYRGPRQSGKTTRLLDTALRAGQDVFQIIDGSAYNPSDLELLVRNRVGRGYRTVCIDDCSEQHIERLEGLKGDLPADLRIHAVVASGEVA